MELSSFDSSWPGSSRPSTPWFALTKKDVDARHKAGHDGRSRCARSAKAPLQDWQDTLGGHAPVQAGPRLRQAWPTAIAAMTISFGIGQTLGPIAVGAITDALGSLSYALNVSAAMLATGALAAGFQRKLER